MLVKGQLFLLFFSLLFQRNGPRGGVGVGSGSRRGVGAGAGGVSSAAGARKPPGMGGHPGVGAAPADRCWGARTCAGGRFRRKSGGGDGPKRDGNGGVGATSGSSGTRDHRARLPAGGPPPPSHVEGGVLTGPRACPSPGSDPRRPGPVHDRSPGGGW